MSTIGRLFGRSPFGLLQRHMEQVAKCVGKLDESLNAVEQQQWDRLDGLAEDVSRLEHQADQIKDDVRSRLRAQLFMPIDRNRVLDILSIQDNLADLSEDICVLLTFKPLKILDGLAETFREFRTMNIKAFHLVESIIRELDEPVETGFGGAEAEKVRNMVHDVAFAEHRVDVVQRQLLKALFTGDDELSYRDFHLWMRLTRELANLSNQSENLANRVQATLELK